MSNEVGAQDGELGNASIPVATAIATEIGSSNVAQGAAIVPVFALFPARVTVTGAT